MGRVIIVLIVIGLTLYALTDLGQSESGRVRLMPRWLWGVFVVAAPVLGSLAWFAFGRPTRPRPTDPRGAVRPLAPDDDPDFLRGL